MFVDFAAGNNYLFDQHATVPAIAARQQFFGTSTQRLTDDAVAATVGTVAHKCQL